MESLAYLHTAVAYEEWHASPVLFSSPTLLPCHQATKNPLSSQFAIRMVSIVCSLGVLGLSNSAWALLMLGDTGSEVRAMQELLNRAGYSNIRPDGVFGSITADALADFQSSRRLSVDSKYGPETQAALLAASNTVPEIGFDTANAAPPLATPAIPGGTSLRLGDRGPGVEALQTALLSEGYNPGPIDGVFGSQTESAVIAFQSRERLAIDGVAGPETLEALDLDVARIPDRTPERRNRNRYIVVVPGRGETLRRNVTLSLDQLNPALPTAFQADSRRGKFISAGAYNDRSYAESVSEWLRYRGFDARVEYD